MEYPFALVDVFAEAPLGGNPLADWRLRSFTAAGIEVFGAGHNALGAWWWLAATRRLEPRARRGGSRGR